MRLYKPVVCEGAYCSSPQNLSSRKGSLYWFNKADTLWRKTMNNFTIVRPEHLNHHGYLFGGAMLKWIDDFAWLVASRDFNGCKMVTIGMDKISFRHRVLSGSILRFNIFPHTQGRTSMCYDVNVYAD